MEGVKILLQQWWQELHNTPILFSLFLFLCFVYSIHKLIIIKSNTEKKNLPPSPPTLPIIGNLHQLGGLAVTTLRSLSQKYGPLMILHFGRFPTLLVSSAELAEEIMKTNDVVFANRSQSRATGVIFHGNKNIVFSPYGDHWRQLRKIAMVELLNQKKVQELHWAREEEIKNVVEEVRECCEKRDREINLTEMLARISFNMVSRSTVGEVFDRVDVEGKSFGGLARTAFDLLSEFCFEDLFPCLGWMDYVTGLVPKLETTSKAIYEFLDQVIDEHEHDDKVLNTNNKSRFIADVLVHLRKEGLLHDNLNRRNLKIMIMDMFMGSTDTTAITMEWAMAELAKNPDIMKKAQEEVRRVVGKKCKVSQSDINEMVYLKWVIKEALRLHPPTLIFREPSHSVKIKGYTIPPKMRVLINVWAIQRDPQLWDRPEEFIPERFADSSVDFKFGNYGQFIPFGSGRRICPGIGFAVAGIEFVLANLLYWFNWELPNGQTPQDLDMDQVNQLILRKKTPLLLVPKSAPIS